LTLKLSISFFLLALAMAPLHVQLIRSVLVIQLVVGLASIFALIFCCRPMSHFWDPAIPGTCMSKTLQMSWIAAAYVFSVLMDWFLAAMPAFILWNVRMSNKKKLGIYCLLAMGSLYVDPWGQAFYVWAIRKNLTSQQRFSRRHLPCTVCG
jgi:hypothetical protein